MNELHGWAKKWGIPQGALDDLPRVFHSSVTVMPPGESSEDAVQARVRLEAAKKGVILWRNNVGVAQDQRGHVVRFGLANDSKALNTQVKSSDLIGVNPVIIQADHVGKTIGQFVAREIKNANWKYAGTVREKAQLNFLNIVQARGGDACFANGIGTL